MTNELATVQPTSADVIDRAELARLRPLMEGTTLTVEQAIKVDDDGNAAA